MLDKAKLSDESYFRQDLLFRLNTVEITLPPLRERNTDIAAIADYFIGLYGKKYQKPALQLNDEAQKAITKLFMAGNIRALRHAVERAVILCDTEELTPQDFQLATGQQAISGQQVTSGQQAISEQQADTSSAPIRRNA